jgi:4-hydroxythreonine-4-phosphate dehydrogenase
LIKRLLYTLGEPAGIGADITILQSQKAHTKQSYQLVNVSDPDLLLSRAKQLKQSISLKEISLDDEATPLNKGEIGFIAPQRSVKLVITTPSADNAHYILETLDIAIDACQKGLCHGMVTGPIQKSIINDAGIPFSGHTEYLAEKTQTPQVVMMLATTGLKVALATTHIPLSKVAESITQTSLCNTIRILHHELKTKFLISNPQLFICGLNPHAGENGHLGREELDIIIPALAILKTEDIHCYGPLPADTLFTQKYLQKADAVLAMYHDQGLPVLKYKGFGAAANITLGLPIIRTSVDHGTALDLAGTGRVDTGSLSTAIQYALDMTPHSANENTHE